MLLQSQQEAGAVLPRNLLPGLTGQRGLQCPQQIKAGIGVGGTSLGIGGHGAELTELRYGSDADFSQHFL